MLHRESLLVVTACYTQYITLRWLIFKELFDKVPTKQAILFSLLFFSLEIEEKFQSAGSYMSKKPFLNVPSKMALPSPCSKCIQGTKLINHLIGTNVLLLQLCKFTLTCRIKRYREKQKTWKTSSISKSVFKVYKARFLAKMTNFVIGFTNTNEFYQEIFVRDLILVFMAKRYNNQNLLAGTGGIPKIAMN